MKQEKINRFRRIVSVSGVHSGDPAPLGRHHSAKRLYETIITLIVISINADESNQRWNWETAKSNLVQVASLTWKSHVNIDQHVIPRNFTSYKVIINVDSSKSPRNSWSYEINQWILSHQSIDQSFLGCYITVSFHIIAHWISSRWKSWRIPT